MLSLGVMKDGVVPPSEEDRKKILTQMKVRTTLKSDKSWIQQKSDTEEEQNRSTLRSPRRFNAPRSPVSPRASSPNRRVAFAEPSSPEERMAKSSPKKSPAPSSPSGYIIRGVFTKTIDKTPPSYTTINGSQKSPKTASLPRVSQGYKMSTEDYKRLAPYNIKRELSDPGDVQPSVSPDEQKKRTEAASSILRRTASKERSYVLSAAKKSNQNATQEAPPFVAKRIDVEDDDGPRSRSQTVPASAWFNSRGKSEKNDRKSQAPVEAEKKGALISEDSLESRRNQNAMISEKAQVPPVMICPEASPKRSFYDLEQERNRKMSYESTSDTEYKKVEAHLAKSGSWSSESSLSTTATQTEYPGEAKRDETELDTTRSSTLSNESGVTTPESQQGEQESDSDTGRGQILDISKTRHRISLPNSVNSPSYNPYMLEGNHRRSPYLDHQANDTIRSENSYGRPSYLSNRSHNARILEMNRGIAAYPSNQAFGAGSKSYYPFRESPLNGSPRSHRMPFYKDLFDTEVRRNSIGSDRKIPATSSYRENSSASGYDSDPTTSSKGILFVKESVTELSSSPRFNSRSLADLSELEKSSYSSANFLNSAPPKRPPEDLCTYCGREIRNCAKISIENLNICCHEYCFRCGICHKPMGDLLDKIFIHRNIVHCDKCYEKLF